MYGSDDRSDRSDGAIQCSSNVSALPGGESRSNSGYTLSPQRIGITMRTYIYICICYIHLYTYINHTSIALRLLMGGAVPKTTPTWGGPKLPKAHVEFVSELKAELGSLWNTCTSLGKGMEKDAFAESGTLLNLVVWPHGYGFVIWVWKRRD